MKRTLTRALVGIFAIALATATTSLADTLTWKGGLTNAFTSADCWMSDGSHTSPQPGDTVTFASNATLTEETFVLGSGTLTFDVNAKVTVKSFVTFTGAGSLVKTGGGSATGENVGTLTLSGTNSTFSGGVTVLDGVLEAEGYIKREVASNVLGTGPVTVARESGRTPCLNLGVNNGVVTNPINITGPFNSTMHWHPLTAEISMGNNPNYSGKITSEGSFRIVNSWAWNSGYKYGAPVLGPVTVTDGGTLYAQNATWFANVQDCSVVVRSMDVVNGYKHLGGIYFANGYTNANADAVITNAVKGLLQFNEGSSFAGREVVAKGAAVTNALNGAACFGDATVVKLLDGAMLQVAASFVRVPRLFVDEEEVPAGVYTIANFPVSGRFLGTGTLCVGAASSVSTWKGGALGSWTEATNWDNGVPCDGQVAVFNSVTTINAGEVNIGAGGLTVICNTDVTVATNATFTGVGKLTKAGAKELHLKNYVPQNTYAGGTDILCGMLAVGGDNYNGGNRANTLGTGRVTIYRAAGIDASLSLEKWMALTNEVSVVGPYSSSYSPTIKLGNTGSQKGRITATDDLAIGNSYVWVGPRSDVGDISAHGHTVRYPGWDVYAHAVAFVGAVDASLEMASPYADGIQRVVYTEGSFVDPDATYSVLGGSNVVTSTGSIACTNVVVGGSTKAVATLVLQKGAILSEKAKVTIQGTGRLSVASGSKVKVAELWAPNGDGELVQQPVGAYSSAGVPAGATVTAASFLGAGRLRVGEYGSMLIVR